MGSKAYSLLQVGHGASANTSVITSPVEIPRPSDQLHGTCFVVRRFCPDKHTARTNLLTEDCQMNKAGITIGWDAKH